MNLKTIDLTSKQQKELLIKWQDNQDLSAKTDLIYANNKFIIKYISKFPHHYREDLYGVGLLAIQKSFDNFDISKKNCVTTHAYNYIMYAINQAARDMIHFVKLSTYYNGLYIKYKKYKLNNPNANNTAIIKDLKLKTKKSLSFLKSINTTLSIDYKNNGTDLYNYIEDTNCFDIEKEECKNISIKYLQNLPLLEQYIMYEIYGFEDDKKTYADLAKELLTTTDQIRALHRRIIKNIKKNM